MSMKSGEVSMTNMDAISYGSSTKSLVRKDWKQRLPSDLWWKITITLAVVIIASFIIYKAVDDNNESSTKRNLSSASQQKPASTTEESILSCTEGAIAGSHAEFTFQPFDSNKPYTTHGLEFKFHDVIRKPGVESELKKFAASTSEIHYYYNIARCQIGGGANLDKEPYIRGPIVFAIDKVCSKVYYYSKLNSGWIEYSSSKHIKCSAHGNEEIEVDESTCLNGSISNSSSSFVYTSFEFKISRTSGAEFSFETLARKIGFGSRLTRLNKLIASTSKIHYYYNIPRCRIGGGVRPNIRGPTIFAVDEQCSAAYYFSEGKGWSKYLTARNMTCSRHGNNNNETRCFKGSFYGSYATFRFVSGSVANVTGIQYKFTTLVGKLQNLISDYNLTRILELKAGQDVSYYLNLQRCYNGGPFDLHAKPQPIRGPIIFAISQNCSKVYYLSNQSYEWKQYASAFSLICVNRRV